MDWHKHFEQVFFKTWYEAGLPNQQDFNLENIETKEFDNFNNDWIIGAPNLPPGLQTYQLQSVYGFGVMVGLMFCRMLGLNTTQTKLASDWCGRFNLGISLFDYICDELEGVSNIASLQVFQLFTKENFEGNRSLTAAETLLSNLAGSVLEDVKKSAKKKGLNKTDPLFKLMQQLFEAQTFISQEKDFSGTDLKKIKKALYLKSAAPFSVMAAYTARMADLNDPTIFKNARALGKAVGFCYWVIDDAKDLWADLEAGQWNLFLQLAATEDPQIFTNGTNEIIKNRVMNILEHSHHAQKIAKQVGKRMMNATRNLKLSKKIESDNLDFLSASLWKWYHY